MVHGCGEMEQGFGEMEHGGGLCMVVAVLHREMVHGGWCTEGDVAWRDVTWASGGVAQGEMVHWREWCTEGYFIPTLVGKFH